MDAFVGNVDFVKDVESLDASAQNGPHSRFIVHLDPVFAWVVSHQSVKTSLTTLELLISILPPDGVFCPRSTRYRT